MHQRYKNAQAFNNIEENKTPMMDSKILIAKIDFIIGIPLLIGSTWQHTRCK